MNDKESVTGSADGVDDPAADAGSKREPAKSPMSKSMHDGVEVWCDCCSCEAEPYWIEAMREQAGED